MARKATGQVVERKRKRGRVFALRFRAGGQRQYLTLPDGTTRDEAERELRHVLADVERGTWRPPEPMPELELPVSEPTFHEFASEWWEGKRHELHGRTGEDYWNTLTRHLLPFFAKHRLSAITVEEVDRYRRAKVRERELLAVKPRHVEVTDKRGRRVRVRVRPLSNAIINKTLTRLAQILEEAVEYGYIDRNPAKGKKRRLRVSEPRRASIGAAQVAALLQASPNRTHRAILATAIMAGGLRVSELTGLRRSDLNLAHSTLTVRGTKTAAAARTVELPPDLRDELAAYVAGHQQAPDDWLFPGRGGQRRDRNAVRRRVLYPAIERANELLASRELPAISADVTFHSLRRTYASLAAEAGADPAWTAAQIGHARSRFTLDVYTDVRNRRHSPVERIGALVRGDDWAPLGTSAHDDDVASDADALESALESPQGA
jgi:integrase